MAVVCRCHNSCNIAWGLSFTHLRTCCQHAVQCCTSRHDKPCTPSCCFGLCKQVEPHREWIIGAGPLRARRKGITKEEREMARLLHRTHMLCLLSRGLLFDQAANDPLLQVNRWVPKLLMACYTAMLMLGSCSYTCNLAGHQRHGLSPFSRGMTLLGWIG